MSTRLGQVFRRISQMSEEDQDYWAERILDKMAELRAQGLASPAVKDSANNPPAG